MIRYRSNKGITIVALVITVIIMLIIAGVGIFEAKVSIKEESEKISVSELGMIQHAALERYTKYQLTKNEQILVGTKITYEEVKKIADEMGITLKDTDNYYQLSPEQLKELDIKNGKYTYIINYQTGEVINSTKKKTESGKILYIDAK